MTTTREAENIWASGVGTVVHINISSNQKNRLCYSLDHTANKEAQVILENVGCDQLLWLSILFRKWGFKTIENLQILKSCRIGFKSRLQLLTK